jgi:hypothetical protein
VVGPSYWSAIQLHGGLDSRFLSLDTDRWDIDGSVGHHFPPACVSVKSGEPIANMKCYYSSVRRRAVKLIDGPFLSMESISFSFTLFKFHGPATMRLVLVRDSESSIVPHDE